MKRPYLALVAPSLLIGFVISAISGLIPFNYHDESIGSYYTIGIPFKVIDQQGDAPNIQRSAFFANVLFWSILSLPIVYFGNKYRMKKTNNSGKNKTQKKKM